MFLNILAGAIPLHPKRSGDPHNLLTKKQQNMYQKFLKAKVFVKMTNVCEHATLTRLMHAVASRENAEQLASEITDAWYLWAAAQPMNDDEFRICLAEWGRPLYSRYRNAHSNFPRVEQELAKIINQIYA